MDKVLNEYCIGCGLCQSVSIASLQRDGKGFYHPVDGDENKLKEICPSYGKQTKFMDKNYIWGKAINVYYGWSKDFVIREAASSGGVTTSLCIYLIKEKKVDAIIHTTANDKIPYETKTCISYTADELINRCGSRYAISSPLNIIDSLDKDKKYAFVGKPCDIDTLRNYMELNSELKDRIPYLISFFCMGVPSIDAQVKLFEYIGCPKEECISLKYRGDGWPGMTKAVGKDGNVYETDYDSSWGKVLGRDLMPMCRFCLNGLGETADVSSGDAWYLGSDNRPVFSEQEGRNVVFARTKTGQELLKDANEKGYLVLTKFDDYRISLPYIQYAQFERRGTIGARIAAFKLLGRKTPQNNKEFISKYKKNISIKTRWRYFKGTLKRLIRS